MPKQMSDVSSKYGAPMGRYATHGDKDQVHTLRLFNVRLDDGGYDDGGAYWGIGNRLYCLTDDSGEVERFFRATSEEAAKAKALELYPQGILIDPDASEIREEIVDHISRAFFACAWSDWNDEHGNTNVSGCNIMACMPDEIDPGAIKAAQALATDLETQHGMTLADIFAKAVEISGDDGDHEKTAENFGHYAAMEAMGSGVGLYDALGSKASEFVNVPYREFNECYCENEFTTED